MNLLKSFTPLLLAILFLSSCSEDDSFDPSTRPSSNLVAVSNTTIPANGNFIVDLSAMEGESPLSTLTISKDGTILTASDITIDGVLQTLNPLPLTGALKSGFDFTIEIQSDLGSDETATYEFLVEAENGDQTSEFLDIMSEYTLPGISVVGGNSDYLTNPGVLVTIPVILTPGGAALESISVFQNGTLVNASRVSFGTALWSENPYLFTGDEVDGLEANLVLEAQSTADTSLYEIVLEDVEDAQGRIEFYIVTGTPVDTTKTRLYLRNAGGPEGQGGVDLITGESIGSDDADAHLIDMGIDINLPIAENWLQQISGGLATETLKMTSDVTYDATSTKQEIQDIYETSTTVGTTQKISGGEVLVLRTNTDTYMLVRIDEVMIVESDNSDFYELSVKY